VAEKTWGQKGPGRNKSERSKERVNVRMGSIIVQTGEGLHKKNGGRRGSGRIAERGHGKKRNKQQLEERTV